MSKSFRIAIKYLQEEDNLSIVNEIDGPMQSVLYSEAVP